MTAKFDDFFKETMLYFDCLVQQGYGHQRYGDVEQPDRPDKEKLRAQFDNQKAFENYTALQEGLADEKIKAHPFLQDEVYFSGIDSNVNLDPELSSKRYNKKQYELQKRLALQKQLGHTFRPSM